MELTEQFILRQAPNPAAAENGRKLSRGGKFSGLHRSEDGSVCWGECAGSGKTPYRVSIDWADPDSPICRCSCPSRQFPCKHALGLMFEQLSGKNFETAAIPQDIVDKREKQAAKAAKKEAAAQAPKKPKKRGGTPSTSKMIQHKTGLSRWFGRGQKNKFCPRPSQGPSTRLQAGTGPSFRRKMPVYRASASW